jgi:3-hydroxyisobutyrate dehydrogenase
MADRLVVSVLGAGGTMGLPMARNLARAGFPVRAWNRSPDKTEPLNEEGVDRLESPRSACAGAHVVLTILADGDAVLDCVGADSGALTNAAENAVWLQMSTIGEAATDRCHELADELGIAFVDAPVLGTKQPAYEGKLVILASGPDSERDRLSEIFDVLGSRTMWVGDAGAGTRLKVAVNSWILSVVEGAAETLALAEGLGVDPELVLEAVKGGPLDLPYLQMKGKAMIERSFEPSFKLALAAKDARLALEAAQRHELDLPLLRTICGRLAEASAEHGDEDMSATYLTSTPRS